MKSKNTIEKDYLGKELHVGDRIIVTKMGSSGMATRSFATVEIYDIDYSHHIIYYENDELSGNVKSDKCIKVWYP